MREHIDPSPYIGYVGSGDSIGKSEIISEDGVSVEVSNITTGETLCKKSGPTNPCSNCQDKVCRSTDSLIKNKILSV